MNMRARWFGPNGEPPPATDPSFKKDDALVEHFRNRLIATIGILNESIPDTDLRLDWMQTGPFASVAAFVRGSTIEAVGIYLEKKGQAEDMRAVDRAQMLLGYALPAAVMNELQNTERPLAIMVQRQMENFADPKLTTAIFNFGQAYLSVASPKGKEVKNHVGGAADKAIAIAQRLQLTSNEADFANEMYQQVMKTVINEFESNKSEKNLRPLVVAATFAIGLAISEGWADLTEKMRSK